MSSNLDVTYVIRYDDGIVPNIFVGDPSFTIVRMDTHHGSLCGRMMAVFFADSRRDEDIEVARKDAEKHKELLSSRLADEPVVVDKHEWE